MRLEPFGARQRHRRGRELGEGRRVEIFTNRQGAFGASGLKAGRWRVELPGEPPLTYDLIVPESPDGIVRTGDLRPVQ